MIHLEGMGLLGSLTARRLTDVGYPFTWSDIDDPHPSWRACTGIAYPSGNDADIAGLARWYQLADRIDEAQKVPYLYAHKNPPHGGQYTVAADYGHVRRAKPLAVVLNVPAFVNNTRARFADRRTDAPGGDALRVVCHTTAERGDGYLWGWAAKVKIAAPWLEHIEPAPALYARAHRFNLTYAYPIPDTGWWWAGSALQIQRNPKRVPADRVRRYLREWMDNASRLLQVSVTDAEEPMQGWRPRAHINDPGGILPAAGGALTMPPMATDGMRRGPLVVDELLTALHGAAA